MNDRDILDSSTILEQSFRGDMIAEVTYEVNENVAACHIILSMVYLRNGQY